MNAMIEPALDASRAAAMLGVNLLAQSTLLIAAGLLLARWLRRKGAALESAALRTTLAAVLAAPLAALCLAGMGIDGVAIHLPFAMVRPIEDSSPMAAGTLTSPDATPSALPPPSAFLSPTGPQSDRPRPATRPISPEMGQSWGRGMRRLGSLSHFFESPWASLLMVSAAGFWMLASLFLLARLLVAHLQMARLRARATRAPRALAVLCEEAARELHLRPPVVFISRDLSLLELKNGAPFGPEDERLGRIQKNALLWGAAPETPSFTIDNLPPGSYAIFGGPVALMRGASVELGGGEEKKVALPAIELK